MSGRGKAMMGTGEAEGEQRATEAADQALKNPLIDEYSLKGAKGLLINITGGKDLTLFEVDKAVNKIRAEVDSEAELIIGAITDTSLEGKMRVSIVATALDNQGPQIKPVVGVVHRLHTRNSGYNNSSQTLVLNQPAINATEGATALDLNNVIEENKIIESKKTQTKDEALKNISIENASYLQNIENMSKDDTSPNFEVDSIELVTPKLFSSEEEINPLNHNNEQEFQTFENHEIDANTETKEPEMFENLDSDEEYEIPSFLRRQKN